MKLRFLFAILLIISLVSAEEFIDSSTTSSGDDAYSWLSNTTNSVNWDLPSTKELAFSILALNNRNYDVSKGVEKLLSQEDVKNCWPSPTCNIIDTSLAVLALEKTGNSASSVLDWLETTEKPASVGGTWYLQFVSSKSGSCNIICADEDTQTSVNVDDLVDVDGLCGSIVNKKSIKFDVDCTDVGGVTDISLIYRIEYTDKVETYLIQDFNYDMATITVDNVCMPKQKGMDCDLESTLYSTWVLKEINKEDSIHTIPYLVKNIDDDPLHRGLLYLITGDEPYSDWLYEHQDPSGSFTTNIYRTSLVAYSLIKNGNTDLYSNSTNWLYKKQRNGNWGNVLDTSSALIALYGELSSNAVSVIGSYETDCSDGLDDDSDGYIDCDDSDCIGDSYCSTCSLEEGSECTADSDCEDNYMCDLLSCTCELKSCSERTDVECGYDSDCGLDEECNLDTSSCEVSSNIKSYETDCSDGLDDDGDGYLDCDDSDCESDSSCAKSYLWLWILLFILVLFGGCGAFYYINYVKKGKNFTDLKNDVNLFFSKLFKKKEKKSFEQHVAARQKQQIIKPQVRPQVRAQQFMQPKVSKRTTTSNKVEKELEKSLKEAKKLLGK